MKCPLFYQAGIFFSTSIFFEKLILADKSRLKKFMVCRKSPLKKFAFYSKSRLKKFFSGQLLSSNENGTGAKDNQKQKNHQIYNNPRDYYTW